jgi:hypothetical protein
MEREREREIPDTPTEVSVAEAIIDGTRTLLTGYFTAVRVHGPSSEEAQTFKMQLFEYLEDALSDKGKQSRK